LAFAADRERKLVTTLPRSSLSGRTDMRLFIAQLP
jgi:hypothetical protein